MAHERNFFQEGLYAGLGLALRAKETIEDFGRKITEEYKMSEEEGKRFMNDLVKESEETRTRLDRMVEKRLEAYMEEAGVPRKRDFDRLVSKIDELERKLDTKSAAK